MYYSAYHSQCSVKNTDLMWWLNFSCSLSPRSLSLQKNLFAPFSSLSPTCTFIAMKQSNVYIDDFFFILFN